MRSKKLNNVTRLASLSAAAVAGLAGSHSADAAAFNLLDNNNGWTSSSRWSLQSGTDADGVPDADDTITFPSDATVTNQPTVGNGDRSVLGLTLINANGTTGSYNLGATGGGRTLNIGASGLTASTTTGSSTSTFATIMGLTANQTWNIGANTTIQLNNTTGLSGAFQLTLNGAGTLNVNGMTASIGSLVYTAGSLTNPGSAGIALSSTGTALTLSDVTTSMKFSLTGASGGSVLYNGTGAGATIGAVDLANVTRTFDIGNSAGATVETDINGIISGSSGGITKSTGTGVLQFSGSTNNTYGGLTTVSAGTLNLNKLANATAIAGNLTINAGGTVAYTSASTSMIANTSVVTVSGGSLNLGSVANDTVGTFNMSSGSLDGSGTLIATTYGLTGGTINANLGGGTANISSGTVTLNGTLGANANISSGTLALGASDRIANGATVSLTGTGALNMGSATDTVSTLSFNGGSLNGSGTLTSTNTVTIQGSGNTIAANLIGNVNFSGAASLAINGSVTGTVSANNGTLSGSGTINGSTSFLGNGSVNGSGLTFNGPVSFVGNGHNLTGTIVANSGLNVSNTGTVSVGGTVTGAATINGKLKGSGTINGAVTVNSGGILAPGNSPGTLNTGSETWSAGGTYLWEINDATLALKGQDPGYDFINITGGLDLTGIAGGLGNQFTIDANSMGGSVANFNSTGTYTWTIATASTGISGFATNKFNVVNNIVGATGTYSLSINDTAGADDLLLTYVGATNSISLTNSTAGNLADTNNANGNPDSGSDPAHVNITGNFISEVDGLTSNSASGLVVTSQALPAPMYVMLWLTDTNLVNGSTITQLVNSLEGDSDYDIALATVGSGDALYNDIQDLQANYGAGGFAGADFTALVRFTTPLAGANFQWDFGLNSDVVLDRVAIVPEPTGFAAIGVTLAGALGRRRRRHA